MVDCCGNLCCGHPAEYWGYGGTRQNRLLGVRAYVHVALCYRSMGIDMSFGKHFQKWEQVMKVLMTLSLVGVFLCILKLIYDGVTGESPWETSSDLLMLIMLLITLWGYGVIT